MKGLINDLFETLSLSLSPWAKTGLDQVNKISMSRHYLSSQTELRRQLLRILGSRNFGKNPISKFFSGPVTNRAQFLRLEFLLVAALILFYCPLHLAFWYEM